ncbi:hypothetical protein AVEN_247984-1 [Araneus ventricosus]|uniref:Uncharacterized protein n=1 Tax=Araneus ventricosus TaxID=182803 RepID=A0A4Y2CIE1_ARAVE|nr:hypothetical protein AVEN_247984-1 [Araneus ventricosus]
MILSSCKTVHNYLNDTNLIPCDFYQWGNIKVNVYVPPMSAILQDLRDRIATAVTRDNQEPVTACVARNGLPIRLSSHSKWSSCSIHKKTLNFPLSRNVSYVSLSVVVH